MPPLAVDVDEEDGALRTRTGLVLVDSVIAKVDTILNLHLTVAQDKDMLGRLLGKSAAASSYADASGMSSAAGDQLAVLADNSSRFVAAGITGTFTVKIGRAHV